MVEIDEMPVGSDLDALLAEKVMGWDIHYRLKPGERPNNEGREHFFDPVKRTLYLPEQWCPSSNREQAFEVLDHLVSEDWRLEITISRCAPDDLKLYSVMIRDMGQVHVTATEYSLPLAICRAALKAHKMSKSEVR